MNGPWPRSAERSGAIRHRGREHPQRRGRRRVGPGQRAAADRRVGRAAQGRLRRLQQAQAVLRPAAHPAHPHLLGGDPADLRAAQEAEVAGRRLPAQALRRRRLRQQGGRPRRSARGRPRPTGQRRQPGPRPAGGRRLRGAGGRRQRHRPGGREPAIWQRSALGAVRRPARRWIPRSSGRPTPPSPPCSHPGDDRPSAPFPWSGRGVDVGGGEDPLHQHPLESGAARGGGRGRRRHPSCSLFPSRQPPTPPAPRRPDEVNVTPDPGGGRPDGRAARPGCRRWRPSGDRCRSRCRRCGGRAKTRPEPAAVQGPGVPLAAGDHQPQGEGPPRPARRARRQGPADPGPEGPLPRARAGPARPRGEDARGRAEPGGGRGAGHRPGPRQGKGHRARAGRSRPASTSSSWSWPRPTRRTKTSTSELAQTEETGSRRADLREPPHRHGGAPPRRARPPARRAGAGRGRPQGRAGGAAEAIGRGAQRPVRPAAGRAGAHAQGARAGAGRHPRPTTTASSSASGRPRPRPCRPRTRPTPASWSPCATGSRRSGPRPTSGASASWARPRPGAWSTWRRPSTAASDEIKQQKEDYEAKLSALERLHLHEKGELAERHRQELEQANGRGGRAEGELETPHRRAGRAPRRAAGRWRANATGCAAELAEREAKLAQFRDKAADLEAKSAEYEDQILRAYQKLRSDDKLIERAKRALAMSLQVLDERTIAPGAAPGPGRHRHRRPPSSAASQPAGDDPGAGG